MRQLLSFISLVALVCAGSAVAQMPLDTTTRGHLEKPLPFNAGQGTHKSGDLLLIRTDPTGDASARLSGAAPPVATTRYNFTGGEAEAYLTKYGYTNVSSLRQYSSSIWRALAVRNGRPVEVAVDYQGNIFER